MLVFIVSTLTAIVVSSLCSLAEAALLSLNPIRLETLKQQGHTFASLWIDMRKNIGRPIAAILILNTIAHTGGATIAGGAFDKVYGDEWLWLFSVFFTIVILFGTEILPKVIGVAYNERLAPWIAPILRFSIGALRPIIFLTELISQALRKKDEVASFSRADLETLARVARTHGVIEVEQENVILNAAKLRETQVQSIMIPREWIVYLRMDLAPEANFEIARNNFHTRYPISERDSVDGITGYVNFKEMIASAQNFREFKMGEITRSILTVNPEANLNTMLKLFIGHRHHLAVVKDQGGKIIGMVTLEDVIEEIVGEIEDEFDASSAEIIQISPSSWKVGGGVRMEKLKEKIPALEIDAPSELLSQWLQKRIKAALHPGISFSVATIKFTVQQARRGKVHEVKIEMVANN